MIGQQLVRVSIVIALAVSSHACIVQAQSLAVTGMFERTLTVNGPVDLEVQAGSGGIQIRRGGSGEVRVVGRLRAQGAGVARGQAARASGVPHVACGAGSARAQEWLAW